MKKIRLSNVFWIFLALTLGTMVGDLLAAVSTNVITVAFVVAGYLVLAFTFAFLADRVGK